MYDNFKVEGLTRRGIEPESIVFVEDAIPTLPLIDMMEIGKSLKILMQ